MRLHHKDGSVLGHKGSDRPPSNDILDMAKSNARDASDLDAWNH